MDFLRQLYAELLSDYSFYIITWLVGAFLIGWIMQYFIGRSRRRALDESLEQSRLELKQAKKLKKGLQEKYDLKEADYKKVSLSLTDKSKIVNDLEGEKRSLSNKLQTALQGYEKSKIEYQQTSSRLEELNDQILGLRTKNAQLNTELQQASKTINQYADSKGLSDKLEELELVIVRLREENASLKAIDQPALVENYEALELKIAELEADKERLNVALSEITQLEEGNAVLHASITRLIKQNESLEHQVEELAQYEAGNEALNTTILRLMKENEALKTAIESTQVTSPVAAVPASPVPTESTIVTGTLSAEQARAEIRSAIGHQIKMATALEKDDLKKINGIGPFIEEKLNDLGIYTYEQLSQIKEPMIPVLTAAIEFFPDRIERDDWIGQADRLAYMKKNEPRRVVRSRTVVTRPSEENFLGEKKAVQEKIIVESTPKKEKIIRRPIKRIVRRESVVKNKTVVPKEETPKEIKPTPKIEEGTISDKIELAKEEVTPPETPTIEFDLKERVIEETVSSENEKIDKIAIDVNSSDYEEQLLERMPGEAEIVSLEQSETTQEAALLASEVEEKQEEKEEEMPITPDNLQKIEGIGPKISKLLNESGIETFQQLAEKSYEELQDIIDEAGPRFRIARPKSWPEQAALAAAQKWEELKEYQDKLRGGVA